MNDYYHELLLQVKKGMEVFIAPGAHVFGQVELGNQVSVWFNAVIRADIASIQIGEGSNIQDCAVVHVDHDAPCHVGAGCVIGHSALIHGCTLGHNVLVGMRATVMSGAVVGHNCIIGAHALVTGHSQIPPNSLVLGSPGKVVRPLFPHEIQSITDNAERYRKLAAKYLGYKVLPKKPS